MLEILMAFAPLIFLIVYALKTRRMAESMVLATLLAMALLHRQHFLTGTIDALYAQLSNSSYQFVLCIIIGFGGMITLFQESGALMGFRDLLLRVAKGPKRTLVPPLAFLLVGATVFAVGGCCAAQVCFDRIQAGAGIREGVHSRSSRVLNSTARRFSGILPLIYNEGGVIPIWILTAVTIRVTS